MIASKKMKEQFVLEMSARLNLDPGRGDGGDRMTGVMGMTGLTWMTEKEEEEEKEEKEEEKEEEGKFLRTGGPTKGSTRGPCKPKKDSEDVSTNFSISACNDGTCIPIEERLYF